MSKDNIAFHRTHMLPEAPPPVTETGAIKWLRENLFSSVANGLLTVVAGYLLLSLVITAAPWFVNGIWDSPSLTACREMLDGRTGACFAVLTERWNQLLYGFKYPSELYWRPTLAFVLLFVAI
ncbi:MAG: amino acid ABC transporter permease, partial [Roseovarius sp.]